MTDITGGGERSSITTGKLRQTICELPRTVVKGIASRLILNVQIIMAAKVRSWILTPCQPHRVTSGLG